MDVDGFIDLVAKPGAAGKHMGKGNAAVRLVIRFVEVHLPVQPGGAGFHLCARPGVVNEVRAFQFGILQGGPGFPVQKYHCPRGCMAIALRLRERQDAFGDVEVLLGGERPVRWIVETHAVLGIGKRLGGGVSRGSVLRRRNQSSKDECRGGRDSDCRQQCHTSWRESPQPYRKSTCAGCAFAWTASPRRQWKG
ncbi:MAG: hypothetical protein WA294_08900 [Acidobacteriaceae bacterium]